MPQIMKTVRDPCPPQRRSKRFPQQFPTLPFVIAKMSFRYLVTRRAATVVPFSMV
jgi:hypothetical protein